MKKTARVAMQGQAIIEVAMVLPVVLAIFLLTINAEFSLYQFGELQDAADAGMRSALVSCAGSTLGAVADCEQAILNDMHNAAPLAKIPDPATDCSPAIPTFVFSCSLGPLFICIIVRPTLYSPSNAGVLVRDSFNPLGPVPIFRVNVKDYSMSTAGPQGIPGTADTTQMRKDLDNPAIC